MKRIIFVFVLLFSLPGLRAENCIIYGRAAQGSGAAVDVYMIDDYITNTETRLGGVIAGDSGKFSIAIDVNEITWVFLKCENLYGFVFATPGKKTEVFFPDRDPDYHVSAETQYEVPIIIWTTDSTDMNFLASDYNDKFNFFWGDSTSNRYLEFVSGQSAEVLDTFHNQMTRHYRWVKNPYFHTWLEYGFASMENATFQSENRTGDRYLVNKPIQYHNHEYMGFFNTFFKDYVYRWSMKKQGERIYSAINIKVSYDSAMYAMRNLPWLKNDTLRELVLLKGLTELYYVMSYDPRNVIAVAQQVSIVSKISEHRQIARNIVAMFTKLKIGSPAPLFNAVNTKGESFEPLTQYKGKFIYLFFYASWNVNSVNELRYMAELQKKYGKQIAFVSISVDEDTTAWKKFMKANPKYNWMNLHYDFNSKIKEDYSLFGVPVGFLIDPEGKFYASPADNPSGDLEYLLHRVAFPTKAPLIKPQDK
ncbi:MAG TPA: TlpA disulfide reductase family protein [Bacteroidia bacterium]|nr:TlpA disulfide reductase family protein [Bacteroidia bacterium]